MISHTVIDDYLNLIDFYRDKKFCKEQIALLKFIPKVLSEKGVYILPEKIDGYIEFIENYFFKMMPYQKFRGAFIVGVYAEDELPLFDRFFTLGGRGMGKTGELASTAAYLVSNRHGVQNYDIDIIANSEQQSLRTFTDIYDTIKSNPKLRKAFYFTKEIITFKKTYSTISYLSSNPKTADGRRPGALMFDEVHAMENYKNMETNESGLGKVDYPRKFYYTTDGYVRAAVLDDFKEKSRRILFEDAPHQGFLPLIFKMDNKQEIHDPSLWIKANPRIEYSKSLARQIKNDYNEAMETPAKMNEFKTKRMNLSEIQDGEPVATWEEIVSTNQEMIDLTDMPCIGAIDFSAVNDFTAVGLVFRVDRKIYVMHHTFIHEGVLNRIKFNVPIELAVEQGLATIVKESEYKVIPTSMIVEWFIEKADNYQIRQIVADRFRLSYLREEFLKNGIELGEVGNGTISHNIVHPIISKLFKEHSVVYGDDLLMRWYTNNVYVETDKKGNKSYKKIEPIKRKTDGFFMFIHGIIKLFENVDYEDQEQDSVVILV